MTYNLKRERERESIVQMRILSPWYRLLHPTSILQRFAAGVSHVIFMTLLIVRSVRETLSLPNHRLKLNSSPTVTPLVLNESPRPTNSNANGPIIMVDFHNYRKRSNDDPYVGHETGSHSYTDSLATTTPTNDDAAITRNNQLRSSSFWFATPLSQRHALQRTSPEQVIPYQPYLDTHEQGALPFGSYRTYGNPAYDPKPTCVLTMALDFTAIMKSSTSATDLGRD